MIDLEVIEKHLFTRPDRRRHADLKEFRCCLRESAPFHVMPDEELWKVARRGTGVRLHKHDKVTIEPVDGLLVVLKGCLKRETEGRGVVAPLLLETRESYDCRVGLLDKAVYVANKETLLLTVSTSTPSLAASSPLRPVELPPTDLLDDEDGSVGDGPKESTIYKRTRSRLTVQSSGGDGSWRNLRRSLLPVDASLDAAGVALGCKGRGRARSTGRAAEGGSGSSEPSKKPRTSVPSTMPSRLPVKPEYSVAETSQIPSMASAEATKVTPSTSEDEAPLSDSADDSVSTAAGCGVPAAEVKADDDAAKGSESDGDVAMGGLVDAATSGLRSDWAPSSSSSSSGDVVIGGGGAVEEQGGVTIASRRIVRAASQVEMGVADHLIKKALLDKLTERLGRTAADIQLMDINKRVNKTYDNTKATYPLAPEFLVFHGSSYDACLGIASSNFSKAENRGEGRLNFFVSTDPAVADRWARARTDKLGGRASIVVSKLLFMRDADIRTSGCTGGTIRIPYACPHLLRPMWIVRYTPAAEPMAVSGDGWKVALEQTHGAVRAALCKHIIMTRHKAPAFDEPLRG